MSKEAKDLKQEAAPETFYQNGYADLNIRDLCISFGLVKSGVSLHTSFRGSGKVRHEQQKQQKSEK